MNSYDDPIYHKVVGANKKDEYYTKIRNAITEDKDKFRGITLNKCSVQDEILYRKDRLWISDDIYTDIIREIYNQPSYGHLGVAHIYKLLKREYYWRGMRTTVATYIQNCYTYQRTKAPRDREHNLL